MVINTYLSKGQTTTVRPDTVQTAQENRYDITILNTISKVSCFVQRYTFYTINYFTSTSPLVIKFFLRYVVNIEIKVTNMLNRLMAAGNIVNVIFRYQINIIL